MRKASNKTPRDRLACVTCGLVLLVLVVSWTRAPSVPRPEPRFRPVRPHVLEASCAVCPQAVPSCEAGCTECHVSQQTCTNCSEAVCLTESSSSSFPPSYIITMNDPVRQAHVAELQTSHPKLNLVVWPAVTPDELHEARFKSYLSSSTEKKVRQGAIG